jgi:hypothetical protein
LKSRNPESGEADGSKQIVKRGGQTKSSSSLISYEALDSLQELNQYGAGLRLQKRAKEPSPSTFSDGD